MRELKWRKIELTRSEIDREWDHVEIGDIIVCIADGYAYGLPFEVDDICIEEQATIINDKIVERTVTRKYIMTKMLGLGDQSKYFKSFQLEKGCFVSLEKWIEFQEAD